MEDFLSAVGRRKQPFLVRLRGAETLELEGGVLKISGHASLGKALERDTNRNVLDDAVKETWGDDATWTFVETAAAPAPSRPDEPEQPPADASQDPRVQQVLDIFGGTVERVVQHNGPQD